MSSRLHTHNQNTKVETPNLSTAQAQGMYQSRPMQVQSQTVAKSQQQPDLKTSLMRALRYGHHLSQMHPVEQLPTAKATATSLGSGNAIQRAKGTKRPAPSPPTGGANKKIKASDADDDLKKLIASQPGTGNERTFNSLKDVAETGRSTPTAKTVTDFTNFVDPHTNTKAKQNIAKLEQTSRDKPIKELGDRWGHGMNEPLGTRNLIQDTKDSAGLTPGVQPLSYLKGGGTFDYLHSHQSIRTDTALTLFPHTGQGHAGALKEDLSNKGFMTKGNANYDKAMDAARAGTVTPWERTRRTMKAHLGMTAKPDHFLGSKPIFKEGFTVKGDDLATSGGRQNTADRVGPHRNATKKALHGLRINTDVSKELKPEKSPLESPVAPNYPVPKTPTEAQLLDAEFMKKYLNPV